MRLFLFLILMSLYGYAYIGQVVLKNGDVSIIRDTKYLKAKNGSKIFEKDTITTAPNARAQIKFKDSTVITIGENSSFVVEEYLYDTKKPKAAFSFSKGAFKSITGKIGKIAPQNFKLKTKTATIGIRGTTVLGDIKDNREIIACLRGKIAIQTIGVKGEVIVPAGKFTQIKPGTPPKQPMKLTPKVMQNISSNISKKSTNNDEEKPLSKQGQDVTQGEKIVTIQPLQSSTNPTTITSVDTQAVNNAIQRSITDQITQDVITQTAEELGTEPNQLEEQLENQECPVGTMGEYPNCVPAVCPEGTTGTYPDCGTCDPTTQTGTYPNCVDLTCPEGTTGTYPDCGTCDPTTQTGTYPNCVDLTCPEGTTGTYPDCTTTTNSSSSSSSSSSSTTNENRNKILKGTISFGFNDISSSFFGLSNSEGNYTLVKNTLTSNNSYKTYLSNGDSTSYPDLDINWSIELPLDEAGTSYTGYNSYSGVPMNLLTPEANSTIYSGTSTIYADNKQEFFINIIQNSDFTYLETAGIYTTMDNLLSQPSYFSSIVKYTAPYSSSENVWFNINNGNILYIYNIPNSINDSVGILLGTTMDKGDGNISLTGTYIESSSDYSTKERVELSTGHLYGSEFQGIDMFGISIDQNDTYNVESFAGYRDTTSTQSIYNYFDSTNNPNLILNGYANLISLDGVETAKSKNFNFALSKLNGHLISDVTLTNDISFSESYSLSSYVNRDYFAIIYNDTNGEEGWLVAQEKPDNMYLDIMNWGYWSYIDSNIAVFPSVWVAGNYATEASEYLNTLPTTTTLSYDGNIMGYVISDYIPHPINSSNSNLSLEFKIGDTEPIIESASFLNFSTEDSSSSWSFNITNNNAFLSNGIFGATLEYNSSVTGDINGTFYGFNAEGVGGTFGIDIDSNITINGVFMASNTGYSSPEDFFKIDGFATSYYKDDDNNTVPSINNTLTLTFESNTTLIGNLSLYDSNDSSETPLYSMDINASSIISVATLNDFNLTELGDTSGTGLNTVNNTADSTLDDYVSWGYWKTDNDIDNGSSALAYDKYFWVAGKDKDLAANFISTLISNSTNNNVGVKYIYNGNILGEVSDDNNRYDIDPATDSTNSVRLSFDFGGGSGSIVSDDSYIKFTVNNTQWHLTPNGQAFEDGTFNGILDKGSTSAFETSSGKFKGEFYGSSAQAIGGVFEATSTDSAGNSYNAIGVFKALHNEGANYLLPLVQPLGVQQ